MSNQIQVSFVKTHIDAKLPKININDPQTGDSGSDIYCVETTTIPAKGRAIVPVGLKLGYVDPGYWIRIESRSGLQFKDNLRAFNGIIDNQYRGDLSVMIHNDGDQDQVIYAGDRCAQLVVYPLHVPKLSFIDKSRETERGENGFGSSGKN